MDINRQHPSKSEYKMDALKKPYEEPELLLLGDLRSVILGGSLGLGESGSAGVRRSATPGSSGSTEDSTSEDPYAPEDPNEDPAAP
jgi:hypothetical protein